MNPSLVALVTPILITLLGYFTPQINDFVSHNASWLVPAGVIVGTIWNHFVTPINQRNSLIPPKK